MKNSVTDKVRGFSLVELLVVIAVIGVLASVAVMNLLGIRERSVVERNRNNAQSFVNVYTAARAAGVTFESETLDDLVAKVREGRNGRGLATTTQFRFDLPVASTEIAPFVVFTPKSGASSETLFYKTDAMP